MLIGEPARTAYDLNFRVGDVPVRVHPLFWLVAILIGAQVQQPVLVLVWIAILFFSILIHELGHVLAFRYYGQSAHVVLYSFGGLAIPGGGYGGYQGGNRANRGWSRIVISLAGPAAGFVFAALMIAVLFAVNRSVPLSLFGFASFNLGMGLQMLSADQVPSGITTAMLAEHNIALVPTALYFAIERLLWINIVWGLVNLLPIYPLDGGQVSREAFLMNNPGQGINHSLMLSLVVAAAVAAFGLSRSSLLLTLMFGMLAYQSYQAMQMNRGGWGGGYGGGRPW